MAYAQFNGSKPVTSPDTRQESIDAIRNNGLAVRDMAILGTCPGFDFSTSGGTPDQPAITLRTKGLEVLRASITWGTTGGQAGNPTSIVYEYSADGGSTWNAVGTVAFTYDTDGYPTGSTWS